VLVKQQVYQFEGWEIKGHEHPSGIKFWVSEKVEDRYPFGHPLSNTRIFRDRNSAFDYIKKENTNG